MPPGTAWSWSRTGSGHDLRYSLDITKIGEELGYAPAVDLADGLAETVAWYAANREWWEPLKTRAALTR